MYDMANVKKMKAMKEVAPEVMAAFTAFDAAVFKDGAIPAKMKELIAIAVAVTTQCPYCIEIHAKRARTAGCTDAEITEASMVAAAIRAGGAVTHATHAIG
jgi:AhpD family alkylhydroperoxidase